MKQIGITIFLLIVLFSCVKTDNNIMKVDCPYGKVSLEPVVCNSSLCQSDTCQTYFRVWKELFIERNHMTTDYFNDHITPCFTYLDKWDSGISFRITYKVKIDWSEDLLYDQFIIWLSPSTAGLYPSLNLPRNLLLTKDQINTALNIIAFSSSIYTVEPVSQLKYSSFEQALGDLQIAAGVDQLCSGEIYYERPNMVDPPSGHPFLQSNGRVSGEENKCFEALIDLVTGETNVNFQPCIIYFCFTGETQIALNNGRSKPIEDIRINDTILSVDLNTMKPEKDIVRKIDVVTHDGIVRISFTDGTENNNTFDHPYLVQGKGWCSYKPAETSQKYRLETKQLQIGDKCYKYVDNKLTTVLVKEISERNGKVETYNISKLQNNKNYFANQILVSNEEN